MYLESPGYIKHVKRWIHVQYSKSSTLLEFGSRGENPELTNSPEWLLERRGQVMVLSSPRIPGQHYATSVQQLLDAVNELENLHAADYVHGDIRAFNIIFSNSGARLIDFDMSGKVDQDSTRYPQGYAHRLLDGRRVGNPGERIMKRHDWRALMFILFTLHEVQPPPIRNQTLQHGLPPPPDDPNADYQQLYRLYQEAAKVNTEFARKENLLAERKAFSGNFAVATDPDAGEIEKLKGFLGRITNWTVSLSNEFEADLNELGLTGSHSCAAMSKVATGSPSRERASLITMDG
jgi:serine/threonine protein kinase